MNIPPDNNPGITQKMAPNPNLPGNAEIYLTNPEKRKELRESLGTRICKNPIFLCKIKSIPLRILLAEELGIRKSRGIEPTIAELAKHENPWQKARNAKLVRHDYKELGEILEPGVNFFVLMLDQLGAKTKYSCEGHPVQFYINFLASHELACQIANAGYFTVSVTPQNEYNPESGWNLTLPNSSQNNREKNRTLEAAAKRWIEKLPWQKNETLTENSANKNKIETTSNSPFKKIFR